MEWGWEFIFQALVVLGGSGVFGVALKGFLDRRKTNIDAGSALSNAALARMQESDKRVDAVETDMKSLRVALREHDKWDREVQRKLHAAGIDVEPPPEIWVL